MRVFFLDDRIPYSRLGCGYPRTVQLLRSMRDSGFDVCFFPMLIRESRKCAADALRGIEVAHDPGMTLEQYLGLNGTGFDCIFVSRPHNLNRALPALRRHASHAALIYDAEAVFASRTLQRWRLEGVTCSQKRATRLLEDEMRHLDDVDAAIAVSPIEAALMREYSRVPVHEYGYSVAPRPDSKGWSHRRDLLFIGSFVSAASANRDAVEYFTAQIMPTITSRIACRLRIAGTRSRQALSTLNAPWLRVEGELPELDSLYDDCRVFVAPARYGAGIPLKVLEAMSAGIPCVVSDVLAAQLGIRDDGCALVAGDAITFAEKVVALYENKNLWDRTREKAWSYLDRHCHPETLRQRLVRIVRRSAAESVSRKSALSEGPGRRIQRGGIPIRGIDWLARAAAWWRA